MHPKMSLSPPLIRNGLDLTRYQSYRVFFDRDPAITHFLPMLTRQPKVELHLWKVRTNLLQGSNFY